MLIKVGEIVKKEVYKSGITKVLLAKKIGISRVWLAKLLDDEELEASYVISIGKAIRFDFSKYFPELISFMGNAPSPSTAIYENATMDELKTQVEALQKAIDLRDKHIALQEKYIKVLEDLTKP